MKVWEGTITSSSGPIPRAAKAVWMAGGRWGGGAERSSHSPDVLVARGGPRREGRGADLRPAVYRELFGHWWPYYRLGAAGLPRFAGGGVRLYYATASTRFPGGARWLWGSRARSR